MRRFFGKELDDVTAEEAPSDDARPQTGTTSRDEPGQAVRRRGLARGPSAERDEPSLEQAVRPPVEPVEQVIEREEPITEQAAETPVVRVEPPIEHVEPVTQREEPVIEQAADPPVERAESVVENQERVIEHARLVGEVKRLELELERYRDHAQRTSQLFHSVTKYAEWVRENARRDGELALRKARARATKIEELAREQEQTEREVARLQAELSRLQALTNETRTRLAAFLTAGLQAITAEAELRHNDGLEPALHDLQETLRERLTPTPAQPDPDQSLPEVPPR